MFDEIVGKYEACEKSLESGELAQATIQIKQLDVLLRQYFDAGQQSIGQAEYIQLNRILSFLHDQTEKLSEESKSVLTELGKLNKGKSMVKAYESFGR